MTSSRNRTIAHSSKVTWDKQPLNCSKVAKVNMKYLFCCIKIWLLQNSNTFSSTVTNLYVFKRNFSLIYFIFLYSEFQKKRRSRDAARSRRGQQNDEFVELANQLPLPVGLASQLDRLCIMRLVNSYIKMKNLLQSYVSQGNFFSFVMPLSLLNSWMGKVQWLSHSSWFQRRKVAPYF